MKNVKWMAGIGVPAIALLGLYIYSAMRYSSLCGGVRASCLEHRKAGCSIDGIYNIQAGNAQLEAACDMGTDGGGWTLVANYLHRARPGMDSRPNPIKNRLPLQRGTSLGKDETGTLSWGHADNAMLSSLGFREMRFRCRTTAHSRLVDFVLTDQRCLEYFRTGKGSCVDSAQDGAAIARTAVKLAGSDSFLPGAANKGWKDQGDNAMISYPFFLDWKHHWSVGAVANRFECDDYEAGATTNTWHQIWVR